MSTEQKTTLTPETVKRGGRYNWIGQPERLVYVGRPYNSKWHQFWKVGQPDKVWCEVRDADLHMLEETKP